MAVTRKPWNIKEIKNSPLTANRDVIRKYSPHVETQVARSTIKLQVFRALDFKLARKSADVVAGTRNSISVRKTTRSLGGSWKSSRRRASVTMIRSHGSQACDEVKPFGPAQFRIRAIMGLAEDARNEVYPGLRFDPSRGSTAYGRGRNLCCRRIRGALNFGHICG